jgi:predicted enzyme related to lactoylglutathione lyase
MHGGAVIRFTDVAAASRPMEWSMTFNGKGKLLRATHSAAPKSGGKVVERKPVEVQGKPVQASDPSGKVILIK